MTTRELLEAIVIKLDHIDQRLDKVEQRLDKVERRLDKVEQRLDTLEQRFDSLEQRVSNLESGQISMERRITNLDLSRKFDQALKVKEDDELIRIRLNVLENDVRKIKQRLEIA